jgi:DNA-binding FadR family transcriptional regulator
VLISSQEDKNSLRLWQKVVQQWSARFAQDQGDPDEILKLRLMSDGLWFTIMYEEADTAQMAHIERIIFDMLNSLAQEE